MFGRNAKVLSSLFFITVFGGASPTMSLRSGARRQAGPSFPQEISYTSQPENHLKNDPPVQLILKEVITDAVDLLSRSFEEWRGDQFC